jgi:hypothetical protein
MHHMKVKKAQSLVGNEKDAGKIIDILLANEFTNEEALEFVKLSDQGGTNAPEKPKHNPNDGLDLEGFNYKDLTGGSFKKYVELVGDRSAVFEWDERGNPIPITSKLRQDDHYDFVLMRVDVVRKVRFPGVKDSPVDYVGLRVKDDTPIHTSRISVATALEYNAQIVNAHGIAGHGKYYFLKK